MRVSRWVTIGVIALLGVLVLLGLTGHQSVHAERVIPYPAPAIWAVVTDAGGYEEWNPILVRAEGLFEEGRTMRYQMRTADGGTTPVEPVVRRLVDGREINQFGGMRGVLTFDHTWRLEPVAGGTRVTQHEEYRGIGVWFWDPAWVESAYQDGLVALEARLAD
ncbi:MAG: hypothetical protein F4X99_13620 [Gammaproteobacteria bacterium]|nr:hypothetical protein [Gammaproteobacteria bacterium]MYE81087.1 hypothetical protein [Gammaproteobacteria bacterium]